LAAGGYAKHSNHIYYNGEIVEGANSKHTGVEYNMGNACYLTDGKYIYYRGNRGNRGNRYKKIEK
jgi:hypothetical protein